MSDHVSISIDTAFKYGHFVSGALVVFAAYSFCNMSGVYYASPLTVLIIAAKEKWIDPVVETPETAGSGFTDWLWWTLGVATAFVILVVRRFA